MKKIKNWFFTRFLPMWAKETIFADYKRLQAENEKLLVQLAEKEADIAGFHAGMTNQRPIVTNTGEVKK